MSRRAGEGCRAAAAAAMCLCVCAAGAGPGPVPASRCECPGVRVCLRRREGTEAPLCAALPLPLSERHLCERSPSGLSIERLECETSIVTPWEPDATDPPPLRPSVCAALPPRRAVHSREVRSGAERSPGTAALSRRQRDGTAGRPLGAACPPQPGESFSSLIIITLLIIIVIIIKIVIITKLLYLYRSG